MISFLAFALAFSSLSLAQTSTVSLWIPGADQQSLVGSVKGSKASATTYVLQCAADVSADECGFPGPFTLVEGPSTVHLDFKMQGASATLDCNLYGSTSADCTEVIGGVSANYPGTTATSFGPDDITYMPVVITAGAGSGASASSAAATSTSAAGASATKSAVAKTAKPTKGGSTKTTSGTAAAATSTGGATHSVALSMAGLGGILVALLAQTFY